MTNACVHTPDDTSCPMNEYCDPTMNCVAMLACTPGDGVCDRLDTNACAGLWSCSSTTNFCVHEPAPCPSRPNASTSCQSMSFDGGVPADAGLTVDGGEISADCHWTCNMGYVDTNDDLEAPVGAMSNGCDCMVTGPVDLPDYPTFIDTNCDGIDGTVADAIFVDTMTGNDSNPGTMASPKKTIGAGITAAAAASSPAGFPSPHKDVYISMGTYNERIGMVDGVSLYGGYNAAMGWSRSLSNTTTINSPQHVGIDAFNLTHAFSIQLLTIEVPAATGTASNGGGQTSYGIRVANCSGEATIQGNTITVGGGASAPAGQAQGGMGDPGGKGGDASGTTGGPPGSSSCGAPGGKGAAGSSDSSGGTGTSGAPGTQAPVAGAGSLGIAGPGGSTGNGCLESGSGTTGIQGGTGGPGSPGANGSNQTSAAGTMDSNANYLPLAGNAGLSAGAPGGGGGGGGEGGMAGYESGFNCDADNAGAGGGGGGGGCGGQPGPGGVGGGGSIGIAIVSSQVSSSDNHITTSNGGTGGLGGEGGLGGTAGPIGLPDNGGKDDGNGGPGGPGGVGGKGGGGSGGPGGPSACFGYVGTSPTTSNDNCVNGAGGGGGMGGGNGQSTAPTGPTGASQTSLGITAG